MTAPRPPRVGFILERSLGHTTHAATLSRLLPDEPAVDATIAQIDFAVAGFPARVPVFNSNWTVRSGLRARRVVRGWARSGIDGLFVHTQVPAVLLRDRMRRLPTVLSLDATPLQYDELGAAYEHGVGHPKVEQLKWRANQVCFERAAHIVSWSGWAKQGVVDGYGISPDKVTVIAPGVTTSLWRRPTPRSTDGPVRVLFVGGDLDRKGGRDLAEAVRRLRRNGHGAGDRTEVVLDVVTRAELAAEPGIEVHRGLEPNTPALIELFHEADVFALPTKADTLGLALLEAGAAGLPLVATTMAGLSDIVVDGETGLAVPPDDVEALTVALGRLVDDPGLRQRLGNGAATLIGARFEAATNTRRLVELVADVVSHGTAVAPR